jgi:hypothetical protein
MYFPQATLTTQLLSNAKRLIVLVPDLNVDETALGRRIWDIAKPARIDVMYLCVVRHWGDELQATHKLAQLLSITNDPMFRTEILVKAEISWFKAIREIQRPGDLIICDSSLVLPRRIFWRKPFTRVLSTRLQIPVITVPLI